MDEPQSLVAIVTLLYLYECCVWLPPTALCISSNLGLQPYRVLSSVLGNTRWQLVFLNPLPWTLGFICESWPGCLHYKGLGWQDTDSVDHFVPFDDITNVVCCDGMVQVSPDKGLRTSSPERANFVRASVERVLQSPRDQREAVIMRTLSQAMDVPSVRLRWEAFRIETLSLRRAATMFGLATVALAFSLYWWGSFFGWIEKAIYISCVVALWLFTILEFRRAHACLYPSDRSSQFRLTAMLLISPFAVVRSADSLARPLFAEFDVVSVAAVLLPRKDLLTLARHCLLECRDPQYGDDLDPGLEEMWSWFKARYARRVESALSTEGIDREVVLKPPHRDFDAIAYCPRCHGQFTRELTSCPCCLGVPTTPF